MAEAARQEPPLYGACRQDCGQGVHSKRRRTSAVGDQYNVPLLGVYDDPSEIDFDSLPDQFVLKCNHNSHYGISICRDRSRFDQRKAVASLRRALKQNYYYAGREWPYKNVKPRVLAEKLLVDESNPPGGITDYKFFCFNGEVDSVMVCTERNTGKPKFYFFSKEWNLKRYNKSSLGLPSDFKIVKPRNVDAMFDLASALSRNIPFVRIDLYSVGGKIYFGVGKSTSVNSLSIPIAELIQTFFMMPTLHLAPKLIFPLHIKG